MTSTATSNLRLELQGTGDNAGTWGTNLNTALQMLDRANGAYGDIAIVDGTNTITVTDYTNGDWHYKVWNLTGALTTAADVVVPTYNKFWYVVNSTTGSQVVTVEVSGQTGVVIPDGGWAIVYCDGTDVEKIIDSDDYQPLDAGLTSIAGLTTAANKMIYTTASDTYAVADLTAAGRAILDDADASAQRTTLGVAIGTDVQAYDADLAAVAALASTGIAVRTASNTWAQRAVAGTANEITATNGDGVSGNPTLSLPAALTFTGKTVTGGTLAGVTINATSTINASVIGGTTPAAATFTTLNATGGGSLTGTWSDLGTVTTIDINGGTVDGTVVGGTTPAAATFTTLNTTGGGSLTGTWSDLGTVTTVDINGGTIDGVVIGGATAAAGTFSTLNATGGGALTGTWTDLGTVTTVDLNGGTIDGTVIGGSTAAAGTFTTITGSGDLAVNTNTLFVDVSTGSVGFGTASPTRPVTVAANASAEGVSLIGRAFDDIVNIKAFANDGTTEMGRIQFDNLITAHSVAGVTALQTTNTAQILFSSGVEAMRVASSGNVGIGTSSPTVNFEVRDSTNGANLLVGGSGTLNIMRVWGGAADALSIGTNGTEGIYLDTSANVGIGTSTPCGKLGIATGGTTNVVAALGGTFPAFTYRNGTGSWFHAGKHPSSDYFYIGHGATPTTNVDVVVDGSGNVGIGTTTIDNFGGGHKTLEVSGSSTTTGGVFKTAT